MSRNYTFLGIIALLIFAVMFATAVSPHSRTPSLVNSVTNGFTSSLKLARN